MAFSAKKTTDPENIPTNQSFARVNNTQNMDDPSEMDSLIGGEDEDKSFKKDYDIDV